MKIEAQILKWPAFGEVLYVSYRNLCTCRTAQHSLVWALRLLPKAYNSNDVAEYWDGAYEKLDKIYTKDRLLHLI